MRPRHRAPIEEFKKIGPIVLEAVVTPNVGGGAQGRVLKTAKIELNVVKVENTKWLVCHDPEFEKKYCLLSPKRAKQAELMNNMAMVAVPTELPNVTVRLRNGGIGSSWITAWDSGQIVAKKRLYYFRTDRDGVSGADVGADGAVMIEGTKLENGPGNYMVQILTGSTEVMSYQLKIAPLWQEPTFSPNILAGAKFDPYTDKCMTTMSFGGWYGMDIKYALNADVEGAFNSSNGKTMVAFENDPDAGSDAGDMTGTHYLRMTDELFKQALFRHEIKC